jgi:hypothetical protein
MGLNTPSVALNALQIRRHVLEHDGMLIEATVPRIRSPYSMRVTIQILIGSSRAERQASTRGSVSPSNDAKTIPLAVCASSYQMRE